MDLRHWFNRRVSRRRAIRNFGILAGASLSLDAGLFAVSRAAAEQYKSISNPINHILIACQENHSFDNYFGYYPHAGKFGLPSNYTQPDGNGATVTPQHITSLFPTDVSHTWQTIHDEWDNGKMDGFDTAGGSDAMGYYDGSDLQYYYALADAFTLCGNYFCSMLGPTVPNRLALVAATSGGNTTDTLDAGSLNFPTIADLLDKYKITWKC